jgi:two-component system copper resistance phosphate regulon response regulator CusR
MGAPTHEGIAAKVLVVDDEAGVRRVLTRLLSSEGYEVLEAASGQEGLELLWTHGADTVLLDVMMPKMDGLEVCRRIRKNSRTAHTPVVFITAAVDREFRRQARKAGADDFLAKPFEFDELIARVRALLRRGQATEAAVLRVGDVELDLAKRNVKRAGQVIQLTSKEFALLEYFMRNADRVLTRTQIGEHVWDMNFDTSSNVIDVYVSMLRRKIDKEFDSPLIHTIIGTGYMFSAHRP